MDALNRKYDLEQQRTTAAANLENTQASVLPGSTASENALRYAQTNLTGEEAAQVAPNAQSQRQFQGAQTQDEYARTQGQNVQNQVTGLDLQPLGLLGARLFRNGLMGNNALAGGGGSGVTDGIGSSSDDVSSYIRQHPGVNQPQSLFNSGNGAIGAHKKGTSNVMPPKGHARAAMNNAQKAKGGGLAAILPSLMAAGGGAGGPPMGGMGMPPSQGAGGGAMMPPPSMAPAGGGGATPPVGVFRGTAQVPGKGTGNVDKVPAMLAPHEAVLTHGAADALGRKKIAALNAANPPGGPRKPTMPPGRGVPKKRA
jgi:hypothetical protein